MTEELYRIGELANMAGLGPRTVDFYTRTGLITPEKRSGKYRLYSPDCLDQLKLIKVLRESKYSIKSIKAILDGGTQDLVLEAARLNVELKNMAETIAGLNKKSLDSRTRSALTALALQGMVLSQNLFLLLEQGNLML